MREHWDNAYAQGETTRSWFQSDAAGSLRILGRCDITPADSVVDIGGGASALAGALLARGHDDLTVLDLSETGLGFARDRLGAQAQKVRWVAADVLTWVPERTFRVWHDRAVFHFLTTDEDRQRYLDVLNAAAEELAVFATFAHDGPEYCSGLPVERYGTEELSATLGAPWTLVADDREEHVTPAGGVQPFTWAAFRRR